MTYTPPTDVEIDAARIRAWEDAWGERLVPGDRIRLLDMPNDPNPVPGGTIGTVVAVPERYAAYGSNTGVVSMRWDNGRTLSIALGVDTWEKLDG